MTFFQILDSLLLQPLQLLFEVVYVNANRVIGNPGLSIIVLSLVMNFLVLPLYMRADALQEEERDMEARLHRGVTHIKKTFRGDEKMMILQTYYRQNHYKPTYVLRSAVSLFLEIPFFIAAYRFLSGLELIKGVSFGPIADLGAADGLIAIAGVHINLLPIIMTAVNLVSCIIFTKGATPKTKIQLYVMAVFFLFFLYTSPAGLVFYWTLNNIFSLIKTIFYKLKHPGRVLKILAAVAGAALLALGLVRYSFSERPVVKAALLLLGAALMLPLCALLALTACGSLQDKVESKLWETAAPALVQGNMDLLYKGACDETYLKLVNSTAEDCASYYDENMTLQAQAFMNVFDVNDLDGTQTDRFADIMKQVYAQAEYTVGAVSQVDDTHFLVDVTVTPLDFPKQVNGALYTGLMTFVNAYGDVTDEQLNAMTDEEYAKYEAAWASGIHNGCRIALNNGLNTLEPVTVQMAVSKADDGKWSIDDDSIVKFDQALMFYPESFE